MKLPYSDKIPEYWLTTQEIRQNVNGGFYTAGNSFCEAKWFEIGHTYHALLLEKGRCSVRLLSTECKISTGSAQKAILYAQCSTVLYDPATKKER